MSAQIKAPHGRDTDAGLKKRHSDSDYNPAPSFSDRRVFACRPGDERLAFLGYEDDAVAHEQAWDGPVFLVIGLQAPEDAIERGCRRFNLDRAQVMNALGSDAEGDQS